MPPSPNTITVYVRNANDSLPPTANSTYNFYVSYANLSWSALGLSTNNIRYFRSYVAYDAPSLSQQEVTTNRITFLWNVTINATSLQKMPFAGQNGSFVLPLTSIPQTWTKIYVGYQFVKYDNTVIYKYVDSFNTLTTIATRLPAIGSFSPGSLTVNDLYTKLNSYKATLGTTTAPLTISSQTFLTHRSGSTPLVYMRTAASGYTPATTGRWFSNTSNGSPTTYVNDSSTSYGQLLTKIENYSVPGFNTSIASESNLSVVTGGISIAYNAIPKYPYGDFPLVFSNVTRSTVAGMMDQNNVDVVSASSIITIPYPPTPYRPTKVNFTGLIAGTTLTVTNVTASKYLGYVSNTSILLPGVAVRGPGVAEGTIIVSVLSSTSSTSGTYRVNNSQTVASTSALSATIAYNPMPFGSVGYLFSGISIYAAADIQGFNPVFLESSDLFSSHPSEGDYHTHIVNPGLHDFVIDYKKEVIGFAFDGYPIVRNYLIPLSTPDSLTGKSYRPIQSSDLNLNHGVEATISFLLNGTTLTYDFYYVATLDFPYTIAAFRGQAATARRTSP